MLRDGYYYFIKIYRFGEFWPKRELIFEMGKKSFSCIYVVLVRVCVPIFVEIDKEVFSPVAFVYRHTNKHFSKPLFELFELHINLKLVYGPFDFFIL